MTDAPALPAPEPRLSSLLALKQALALEDFAAGLERAAAAPGPEARPFRRLLADYRADRGELAAAIALYQRLLAETGPPQAVELARTLLGLLLRQGADEAALALLARAELSQEPDPGPNPGQHQRDALTRGDCLVRLGQPEAARAAYLEALRLAPDQPLAAYALARLQERPAADGLELVERRFQPALYRHYEGLAGPTVAEGDDFGRRFHQLYYGDHPDLSFLLCAQGQPLLRAEATIWNHTLSQFSRPLVLELLAPAGGSRFGPDQLVARAFGHLLRLLKAYQLPCLMVAGAEPEGEEALARWLGSSPWPGQWQGAGLVARPTGILHLSVDLSLSEAALWHQVRKSYRPIINAGRSTLQLSYADPADPAPGLLRPLREAHRLQFGPGYDRFFDAELLFERELRAGRAELALARTADGTLAGAGLFLDHGPVTSYAAGRTTGQGVRHGSHYLLWQAILRSRARGQQRFHLGDLAEWEQATPKLANIAFFKSGFATCRRRQPAWLVSRPA